MKGQQVLASAAMAPSSNLDEVTPKVEFATDSKARYHELSGFTMDMRRGFSDSAAANSGTNFSSSKSKRTVLAHGPDGSLDFYPSSSKLPVKKQGRNDDREKRGESVDNVDGALRSATGARAAVKRGFFDEVAVSTISVGNSRQQKRSLINLANAVGVLTGYSNEHSTRLQPSRHTLNAMKSCSSRDVQSM